MKLDKRNPFAAWGHEEQKYVVLNSENSELPENGVEFTEKQKQYVNIITNNESVYNTVAVAPEPVDEEGNKLPLDIMNTFFTNNENMRPVELQNYALGFNKDNQPIYPSNEELHYYGIQAVDLEKHLEPQEVKISVEENEQGGDNGQSGNNEQGGDNGQSGNNEQGE